MSKIRVRFAPSPTGPLHLGGVRTALYNYLFAKSQGGDFILRIEDTDRNRYTEGSEQMIFDALKWLDLDYAEGPDVGGDYGPYRQSERFDLYGKYAKELVEKGGAYYCFCDQERLENLRERQKAMGLPPGYDGHCRSLTKEEIEEKLKAGVPYVIRLKMPYEGETVIHDRLRGDVVFENSKIDDQVLLKADGYPTYHLANIVDDHLMGITHVIRAEEWIPSTPKHIQLYKAFGWEAPEFIHMPLLRNDDRVDALNISIMKIMDYKPQSLFLTPCVNSLSDRFIERYDVEFFKTDYSLVNTNIIEVRRNNKPLTGNEKKNELFKLLEGVKEPTIVYVKSPYEAYKLANEYIDYLGDSGCVNSDLPIFEWMDENISENWKLKKLMKYGIGAHNGALPRHIVSSEIEMFNKGILSIMFEMKNEADGTEKKHKNADFYKELDKDRREKNCEYAVLVTMLEADNDYFNTGIVDVSHEYEKMYVVRPQFFIQLIGLLRNAALNSLKYKQELALVREQNIDITHFEEDLDAFKLAFAKNYNSASTNFGKAIDEIDKAIKRMEEVKKFLTTSENQLRLANKKLEDVSVKKLTRKNPTMKAKFEALQGE